MRADALAAAAPKRGWQRLPCGVGSNGHRLYERLPQHYETMVCWSMIRITSRHLTKTGIGTALWPLVLLNRRMSRADPKRKPDAERYRGEIA